MTVHVNTAWQIAGALGLAGCTALVSGLVGLVIKRLGNQDKQLSEIHVLVNNRMADALANIAQLEGEITLLKTTIAGLVPKGESFE